MHFFTGVLRKSILQFSLRIIEKGRVQDMDRAIVIFVVENRMQ